MPANLITRQLRAQAFLQMLNSGVFRRLFNMQAREYVAEYDITNNTLKVKLIDRDQLEKYKRGQLNRGRTYRGNRFALGRFNSLPIARVINTLNSDKFLKGRFGLQEEHKIQTIDAYGSTSVVVNAYRPDQVTPEDQIQQEADQQNQPRLNIQPPRGTR